jgi:ankyrin repeat protein
LKYHFKYLIFSIALIGYFPVNAGSYEDFFKALELDQPEVVQKLLERGFDPNSPSPQGQPALILAMQKSSNKVAEVLMGWKTTNLSIHNPQMETPLMLAAITNQLDWAKKLIERGADVNQKGWTPLHYAATKGNIEIMRLLIENHAYLDAESPNGTTPLMMAAMYGSPEAVKVLIQAGADLHQTNQLGLSALDFAVRGQRQNAKELIETGLARLAARQNQPTPNANPQKPAATNPSIPR